MNTCSGETQFRNSKWEKIMMKKSFSLGFQKISAEIFFSEFPAFGGNFRDGKLPECRFPVNPVRSYNFRQNILAEIQIKLL